MNTILHQYLPSANKCHSIILAEKCEALATEMRQQTVKAEYERRVSDERHNAEIRRLKQVWIN